MYRRTKAKIRRRRRSYGSSTTHPWVECPCGKITYRTSAEAKVAAAFHSKQGLNVYQCHRSESWHLTSSPQYPIPRRRTDG